MQRPGAAVEETGEMSNKSSQTRVWNSTWKMEARPTQRLQKLVRKSAMKTHTPARSP